MSINNIIAHVKSAKLLIFVHEPESAIDLGDAERIFDPASVKSSQVFRGEAIIPAVQLFKQSKGVKYR